MNPPNKLNWVGIIFWGVIIGGVCLALFWQKDNIIGWIQNPSIPNINSITSQLTRDNIATFLKDYGFLITGATTAVTFIYGIYQKHQKSVAEIAQVTAENEATKIELEANTKIGAAESLATEYKQKYENLLNVEENTLLREAQQTVTKQAEKLNTLQIRYDEIKGQLEAEIQNRPVITKTEVI